VWEKRLVWGLQTFGVYRREKRKGDKAIRETVKGGGRIVKHHGGLLGGQG